MHGFTARVFLEEFSFCFSSVFVFVFGVGWVGVGWGGVGSLELEKYDIPDVPDVPIIPIICIIYLLLAQIIQ